MDMVATAMKADSQKRQTKGKGRLRSKKSREGAFAQHAEHGKMMILTGKSKC